MSNITEKLKEQAGERQIILGIAALAIDFIVGWALHPAILVILFFMIPMAISVAAFYWVRAVEWSKIGIAEEYGAIAQGRMEEATKKNLMETLDPMGVEALEEVERAIERREEDRANS